MLTQADGIHTLSQSETRNHLQEVVAKISNDLVQDHDHKLTDLLPETNAIHYQMRTKLRVTGRFLQCNTN